MNKIYKGLEEAIAEVPAEAEKPAASVPKKSNPFFVITKILSDIFVPILPFIVATGLLRGLTGMIESSHWAAPGSAWMNMLELFSTSALLILPVIIGFSAAKKFGGSPVLGAFIGGLLVHSEVLKPEVVEIHLEAPTPA